MWFFCRLAYVIVFFGISVYRLYIAPALLESCWECSYMITRKFLHEFASYHVSWDLLVGRSHHLACGGPIGHTSSVSMVPRTGRRPEAEIQDLIVRIFKSSNFRISSSVSFGYFTRGVGEASRKIPGNAAILPVQLRRKIPGGAASNQSGERGDTW